MYMRSTHTPPNVHGDGGQDHGDKFVNDGTDHVREVDDTDDGDHDDDDEHDDAHA